MIRHLHKELVCDSSASVNLCQEEVDQQIQTMFDLEDASFVYDLRTIRTFYGDLINFGLVLKSTLKKILAQL